MVSMRRIAAIAAICGGLYGYDTGIVSGTLLSMTREFRLDRTVQDIVTAAILAGAVVGALAAGRLSERLGRKVTIMAMAVIFALGALGCALAPNVQSLTAGRLVLGLAVGGSLQVVPAYISELAPPHLRGRFAALFLGVVALGIVLANGISLALHDALSWRPMVAIAALPAVVIFLAMIRMPPGPRWVAKRRGIGQAAAILCRLRESEQDVLSELRAIQQATRGGSGR
jgi:MFS family permease